MTSEDSPLLTVADVAHRLNVDVQTVWRWIKKGALEAVKLPSGKWRISRHALRDALKQRST